MERTVLGNLQGHARRALPAAPAAVDAPLQAAAPQQAKDASSDRPFVVVLFFILILIPVPFTIAGSQFYPYRLLLIAMIGPMVLAWMSGRAGRIVAGDWLFLGFAVWGFVVMIYHHGAQKLAFAFLTMMEVFGAYLIGRIYIRSQEAYIFLFKCFSVALLVLFPFALMELPQGTAYAQNLFRTIFGAAQSDIQHPPRMGLYRAQTVFPHPILFGLFCSIAIANSFYIWRRPLANGLSRAGFCLFLTFTSLSSGALLAGILQLGFAIWGLVTGNRWKLLLTGVIGIIIFLSLASNRGPIIIIIETLSFSTGTGWTRIIQWNYGTAQVAQTPVFGVGFNQWSRPSWMGASIDNHWLAMAVVYGLPAIGFLIGAMALNLRGVLRATLPPRAAELRTGYVIASISIYLSMATVAIWGTTVITIFMYLGAGVWMFTSDIAKAPAAAAEDENDTPRPQTNAPARSIPYSRAPITPIQRPQPKRSQGPGQNRSRQ